MAQRTPASQLEWMQTVIARYESPLIRYAAKLTGNSDRARDVVQDTFLRLCGEERDKVEGHVAEWLFTVCRNRAVDVQRKESRMSSLSQSQAAAHESRDNIPSAGLEQREAINQVLRVLDTIPESQQEVIRLKFQNGFSYRQISNVTGLSISNVGFLIHTGLKTIRQRMNAEPNAPKRI